MQGFPCLGDPAFSADEAPVCSRSSVRPFTLGQGCVREVGYQRNLVIRCYSLTERFDGLSLRPLRRPQNWSSRSLSLTIHTLRLPTQRIDRFPLRRLTPGMLHSPFSFEISAGVARISQVYMRHSNSLNSACCASYLPLTRRTQIVGIFDSSRSP
jgi:hypothetical protein